MQRNGNISLIGLGVVFLFVGIIYVISGNSKGINKNINVVYQHVLNKDADSTIGITELPSDFKIDETFESHLPLVIIDMQGQRLPNVYAFTSDLKGRTYSTEGLKNPNPWINMNMYIIDNDDYVNRLSDTPTITNSGKIKLTLTLHPFFRLCAPTQAYRFHRGLHKRNKV